MMKFLKRNQLKNEKCLVSRSQKVLYHAAQLVCSAPVRFERRQHLWYMRVSHTQWLVNCCVITLSNICIFSGLMVDISVGPEKSSRMTNTMRGLVWVCELAVTVLSSNICVYGGYERTRQTIIITKKIQKLNATMSHNSNSKTFAFILAVIFILTAMLIWSYYVFIANAITNGRNLYSAALYIPHYLACNTIKIQHLQFIFIAQEGNKTIKLLNERLEDAALSFKTSLSSELNTINPSNSTTISRLTSMYDRAFKAVAEIDECFGMFLLVAFVVIFKDLVLTSYNAALNMQELKNYSLLAAQSTWIVIHALSLIGLVEPCHRTQREVDRTRCLVNNLSSRVEGSLELDRFSRFMALVNVSYSPMGMFTVSRCLIVSILGSVLSHLVILVQFQGQDKGEFPRNVY